MRKKFPIFKAAIKNRVSYAVANRMNGDIVAPTVPTMFIHPKLTEVISEGYNSAMNTKNMPQTAFKVILKHAKTIIYKTDTMSIWSSVCLSIKDKIPKMAVNKTTNKNDILQYLFLSTRLII
jgi:hypothetical protein